MPTARFRVGHGQMDADTLEEIMLDFHQHRFDVLVSTTIVESGLDIPRVNTILIDNADRMGLAQLYQLRGRVGRSKAQGYAYLFYPRAKKLSAIAEGASRRPARVHGPRERLQDRAAGPGASGSREPAWRGAVGDRGRGGLRPLHADSGAGYPRGEGRGAEPGPDPAPHGRSSRRRDHPREVRSERAAADSDVQEARRRAGEGGRRTPSGRVRGPLRRPAAARLERARPAAPASEVPGRSASRASSQRRGRARFCSSPAQSFRATRSDP